jgi:hypothetical protein
MPRPKRKRRMVPRMVWRAERIFNGSGSLLIVAASKKSFKFALSQDPERLQFERKEFEFVLVLFQPVHFEFQTSIGINECPRLVLTFRSRRPSYSTPHGALVKFGTEEARGLRLECSALERCFSFHLCVYKLARPCKRRTKEVCPKESRTGEVSPTGERCAPEVGPTPEGRVDKIGKGRESRVIKESSLEESRGTEVS